MKNVNVKQLKKIKKAAGLSESGFNGAYPTLAHFGHPLIAAGGVFALLLIPIVDITKAYWYWNKSAQPAFEGSLVKKDINRTFFTGKAMLNTVGVSLVISGILAVPGIEFIGFGLLIGGLYASAARSFVKMIICMKNNDPINAAKNAEKCLMSALFAVGLNLIIFSPNIAVVGLAMMVIASTHILLSAIFRTLASNHASEKGYMLLSPVHHAYQDPGVVKRRDSSENISDMGINVQNSVSRSRNDMLCTQ
jgi:hypothetical protein